ncbi:MAG TPA: ABC transporter substrate-binding protein [Candidatus Binatia bacterium]|nr:ABC transporter substrate-binding protein [Candidatus Binatia bacterium]
MKLKGLGVGLAALVVLAACGGAAQSSPSPSSGAKQPATIKLALPVRQTAFAQADIAVAQANGYFQEQNLTVNSENLASGVQSVKAVLGGDADMGGSSVEPVLTAAQKGGIKVIGSYADRLPVVMETSSSISKPSQLKGQKLGIQDVGAFREVMTRAVYESAGLKQADVQYIPVADTSYVNSLVGGQIDAAILQWEQSYKAEQDGAGVHVLADLYKIWPKYFYGTYFVQSDWLQSHRDVATRFETALMKAHRLMYSNRAKVVPQIAKATGFTTQVIDKAYQRMIVEDGVFPVNQGLDQGRFQFTVSKMKELGLLKGPDPNLNQTIDRGPVNDAVTALGGPMSGDQRWH